MKLEQKNYKKFYEKLKPEKGLRKAIKYASKGFALDIGAGRGRNSIFLAKNGFKVKAIDKNKKALKELKEIAKKFQLKISTKVVNIRNFKFPSKKHSLVVATYVLDFFKKIEVEKIIQKIKKSLNKKGIFYLIVFSKKDPWFFKIKKLNLELGIKPIEKNTFYLPKGNFYRHFFTLNEVKKLLKGFQVIYLKEKRIKDIFHQKPHFHWIIELIAKKR